jgi:DNA-binding MarR family transcriptional regulator
MPNTDAPRKLSHRQAECLRLIIRSLEKRGKTPLISELAERLMVTRGSVDSLVVALERKGYLGRAGTTYGFIRLLRDLDGDPVKVTVTTTIEKVMPDGV